MKAWYIILRIKCGFIIENNFELKVKKNAK